MHSNYFDYVVTMLTLDYARHGVGFFSEKKRKKNSKYRTLPVSSC